MNDLFPCIWCSFFLFQTSQNTQLGTANTHANSNADGGYTQVQTLICCLYLVEVFCLKCNLNWL